MNEICLRQLMMLKKLPKHPKKASAKEIHNALLAQGFCIDLRTVQRDLNSFTKHFDIQNDGNKDTLGWYWSPNAKRVELPEMEPAVAFTLKMAELFLKKYMPPFTQEELTPYFSLAESVLKNLPNNNLTNWANKIAFLSRTQPLQSPKVSENILKNIYNAVLDNKQLEIRYQARHELEPNTRIVQPLGIVIIDTVIYLVALNQNNEYRQYALHRFEYAHILEDNVNRGIEFDLTQYINEGRFEYLIDASAMIELELRLHPDIAFHLNETPLNESQQIQLIPNDTWHRLNANIKDTLQLRWWLLSFGANIEVIKPSALRDFMKNTSTKVTALYQGDR